jgi:Trk-type K+ transport system membrane component
VLLAFNLIDLILFLIFDIQGEVLEYSPYENCVLAGFFQAICPRTSGVSVLNLSLLHVSVQISYIVMMYVSVFPIALGVRHTNVYEEQSIGVYVDPEHIDEKTLS